MKKAFKVTITPQNEDHIAEHGDKVVELEADVVILTTEKDVFVATASTSVQIAEALWKLEKAAERIKAKDARILTALEVTRLYKKISGITGLVEDDDD